MENIYKFYINGMHCKACSVFIENKIKEDSRVVFADADFNKSEIVVKGDFGSLNEEQIIQELNILMKGKEYYFSKNSEKIGLDKKELSLGVILGVIILLVFFFLQKAGLVDLITSETLTFGSSFLIGVIASLSSCLVVVGGIVMMLGTASSKSTALKHQAMFQVGRISAFFILGGLLGLAGSVIRFSPNISIVINLLIGLMLLVVGLNLLGLTSLFSKLQISLPKSMSNFAFGALNIRNPIMPLVVGVLTFFMPCGFTQSLQLYSLTTGNFLESAIIMFAFALGTMPVLFAIGLGSSYVTEGKYSGILSKTAAIVLIGFSLVSILGCLTALGLVKPILNF